MMSSNQVEVARPSDPSDPSWGNDWVVVHHLGRQGDADGHGCEDHHDGDEAAAGRGPLAAAGAVRHGGLWLPWELIVIHHQSL